MDGIAIVLVVIILFLVIALFYDFLEEINPIGDKKNILLMDNARIHTAPNKRAEANLPSVEEQLARK